MSIARLARPEIRELEPYRPGRRREGILLDNNESPWSPPDAGGDPAPDMNRYPSVPAGLLDRAAAYYGVDESQLLLTRGSDDGIDALLRTFCRPGVDGIIVSPPTFGMYAMSARIQGADVVEIESAADFEYPLDAVIDACDENTRLVFACSPNNPTGNVIPPDDIHELCEALDGRALVVVDEAYGEFMQQPSAASLLDDFDNLVVLRTLSKGLALAGARIGVLLADPAVLDLVQRVLPPYPIPTPSIQAALRVFADDALLLARQRAEELVARREELAAELASLRQVRRVYPAEANYLLVEFDSAGEAADHLAQGGVKVRGFGAGRLRNCLRISIGTEAETRRLLELLVEREADEEARRA